MSKLKAKIDAKSVTIKYHPEGAKTKKEAYPISSSGATSSFAKKRPTLADVKPSLLKVRMIPAAAAESNRPEEKVSPKKLQVKKQARAEDEEDVSSSVKETSHATPAKPSPKK